MVKILNTSSNNNLFFNSEQYNDCSSFLMKADDPPLEELDPAILSCGLPAIVLSDMQQQNQPHPALASLRAPKIRYTPGQLQAMRKSALCFRRPVVADDPRIGQFAIWRSASQLKRGGRGPPYTTRATEQQKSDRSDDMNDGKPQEKPPGGGIGYQKFHNGRENGFVGPRFRRNYDFNNRNHHVIVKNYRGGGGGYGDDHHHHYRLQDTVIEEEPEWMAAGPTSRLDTIELRGFDEDVSPNASLEKGSSDERKVGGKHISFYDELHHYEHIVGGPKNRGGNTSSGDVESVATSNGSSPPPARSTPTKSVGDCNNNLEGDEKQRMGQRDGVNVNNFEEFMKFDSILGTDSGAGTSGVQSGSRFSKWFRRGANGYNQSSGANFRQAFLSNSDAFGNSRFPQQQNQQRHYGQQSAAYGNRGFHPSESYDPQQQGHFGDESSTAFKRLVDMVAQNRASNNLLAQQQYLMQLLNKNQQSEILRRMLMKNAVDNVVADTNQQQQQQPASQQPRIPTQQELQFHTQSIMQNALLRKKLQDQRKMLYEQAVEPANPAVQQFVQSVCPNIQRSLSVLSQTANQFSAPPPPQPSSANSMFSGGSTAAELSNSLQQMLHLSQPQQGRHAVGANRGRFGKGSVTWNLN
ncbi:protein cup-like [Culex pipiens pallens]|uniref:protein cup-like n=1 Tax=Culex pipiens pallens TaxID=42434 RepID=UPI0019544F93|nr:protein cup-like [Culex pipiens pallens]